MIHTATTKLKFKLLVRRLRCVLDGLPVEAETVCVGLLEKLWHCTAVNAPCGDIGKIDDEGIAEMLGWKGTPSVLIDAMVETKWIDKSEKYRLVVHDWHEHAPNFVRSMAKAKGGFIYGSEPKPDGSDSSDAKSHPAPSPAPRAAPSPLPSPAPSSKISEATPNLTKPNLTKPNLTKPDATASGGGIKPAVTIEKPTPKSTRTPRPRDELYDAIAAATGCQGSHVGKVAAELRNAEPPFTVAEVAEFGQRFYELCPHAIGGPPRLPNVGELEKYISRVRAPKPTAPTANSQTQGMTAKTREAIAVHEDLDRMIAEARERERIEQLRGNSQPLALEGVPL